MLIVSTFIVGSFPLVVTHVGGVTLQHEGASFSNINDLRGVVSVWAFH